MRNAALGTPICLISSCGSYANPVEIDSVRETGSTGSTG